MRLLTESCLVYEHPLNEKVRTYLRVEYLFQQVHHQLALANESQQLGFFTSLFALIEVLDRNLLPIANRFKISPQQLDAAITAARPLR